MSLSDYIPNIISAPEGYVGLLGADPTKKLEKQANLQGLLGAVASLSQGMSSQGPRRSALQNILGSLAGGFGATQQAYQGGLQQFGVQQQLTQGKIAAEQAVNLRKAVAQVKLMPEVADNPALLAALDADPINTLKLINENRAAAATYGPVSTGTTIQTGQPVQTGQYAQYVQPSPVDQAKLLTGEVSQLAGGKELPATIVQDEKSRLDQRLEELSRSDQAALRMAEGKKIIDKNEAARKDILRQKAQLSVITSSKDLAELESSFVPALRPALTQLRAQMADGLLTPVESQKAIADLQKANFEYQVKQQDYTNESIRVAKSLFPTKPINELTGPELGRVQATLQAEAKARSKAGAYTINFADKTLAVKRMDQQAAAEEAANNAQNAASDVRAIVDILKPYKGGRLDEFKAQLGGFFPDTSLAQLSTANDAANAIRAKLAPTLRVVGSGSTSDMETKQFLASLPSLMSYPEGRELAAVYAQRFADRATAAADIKYQMIQDGTYTSRAFQNELKAAGFDKILTADDIAILQGKKKAGFVPSKELDDAVKKYQKK
jgi:hypothetical protein